MIIIKIIGGLGNQMFQYSVGRSLALANNTDLALDISAFKNYSTHEYCLDNYNLEYHKTSFLDTLGFKIARIVKNNTKYIIEDAHNFHRFNHIGSNLYLDGYWQNERYFSNIRDILLKDFFDFTNPLSKETKELSKKISKINAVSIHVRRGDYIKDPNAIKIHGSCSTDYYQRAIKKISEKISNPTFICFSDDPTWMKTHLKFNAPVIYASDPHPKKNYEDLYLMSQCRYHILANSTFSWWGAWLGEHKEGIIIGPKQWFEAENLQDLKIMPDRWMKL